jgi:hypothetical protein
MINLSILNADGSTIVTVANYIWLAETQSLHSAPGSLQSAYVIGELAPIPCAVISVSLAYVVYL